MPALSMLRRNSEALHDVMVWCVHAPRSRTAGRTLDRGGVAGVTGLYIWVGALGACYLASTPVLQQRALPPPAGPQSQTHSELLRVLSGLAGAAEAAGGGAVAASEADINSELGQVR